MTQGKSIKMAYDSNGLTEEIALLQDVVLLAVSLDIDSIYCYNPVSSHTK